MISLLLSDNGSGGHSGVSRHQHASHNIGPSVTESSGRARQWSCLTYSVDLQLFRLSSCEWWFQQNMTLKETGGHNLSVGQRHCSYQKHWIALGSGSCLKPSCLSVAIELINKEKISDNAQVLYYIMIFPFQLHVQSAVHFKFINSIPFRCALSHFELIFVFIVNGKLIMHWFSVILGLCILVLQEPKSSLIPWHWTLCLYFE